MRQVMYVLTAILGMSAAGLAQDYSKKISGSLQLAAASIGADETVSAWIVLTDKGLPSAARQDEARRLLSERAMVRRQKMRPASELIQFKDLPLEGTYVQAIRPMVSRLRQTSRWFNAVSAEVTKSQIDALAQLPFVAQVDLVVKLRKHDESIEWNSSSAPGGGKFNLVDSLNYGSSYTQVSQINVPAVHNLGIHGEGVIVGVFDAGFNNLGHAAFSSMNILATHDFVNGDSSVADDGDMGEGSHGTNTLSVIGGYASGQLIGPAFAASYVLAKTENTESETPVEEDNWIAAVEWAETYGIDVISCSLGYIGFDGQSYYNWTWMNGDSCRITKAADMATWEGIVVVNSAGNEYDNSQHNTLGAPADGDTVIAVGAVNSSGSRVSFSSVGPTTDGRIKPDVMAMGSGVKAAYGSPGATGYESVSGTSFSCPLTAGVCALILSANPSLTPFQVRDALRNTANNAINPNKYYGWGIVNALNAVNYYRAVITHTPLGDTENEAGPYPVTATITSQMTLVPDSIRLIYGVGNALDQTITMNPTGTPNQYTASIPSMGSNVTIGYYVEVVNTQGIHSTAPSNAPAMFYSFHVGADIVAPVIVHSPLGDQGLSSWPPDVTADVTDNLIVDSVIVEFLVNSVPQNPFVLGHEGGSVFSGAFPAVSVALSDTIRYRIMAKDGATIPNVVFDPPSGYHVFRIGSLSVFSTDLNSTNGGFTGTLEWEWGAPSGAGAPVPHSSPNLWATNLDGNYDDETYSQLTLPEMTVASDNASFSFWHVYNAESVYDGGNVKISLNGGPFQIVTPVGGYPLAALDDGNPMAGQPAFSGTNLTWTQKSFNLAGTAHAGDDIVIRLDFASDISITSIGWYVDDFSAVGIGTVIVDVENDRNGIPSRFSLWQNYPNPFNPTTTIRFQLPQVSTVSLDIYNALGQEVRSLLLSRPMPAGTVSVSWDGRDNAGHAVGSGVYLYRLTTNSGYSKVMKMMLLK